MKFTVIAISALSLASNVAAIHILQLCAHSNCSGGANDEIYFRQFGVNTCYNLSQAWNDRISAYSIVTDGPNVQCTLYQHAGCQGITHSKKFIFRSSTDNGWVGYVGNAFNDRASSWRCHWI